MLVADTMLVKILKMHALDDAPWQWQSQWNKDMPDFFQVPNSQAFAHAHGFACASEALLSASLILFSLLTVSWRTQGMKSGVMDNVFDDLDTTPVVSRASVLLGCLRFSVSFLALLLWIHAS